jgi:hypothetical protein
MPLPQNPKIYHIVHVDRLASIVGDGYIWSDREMVGRQNTGTTIGMNAIKARRLQLPIASRPGLRVGDCVPFYFCPRSVMMYLISSANHPDLSYKGGQGPIIHLEANLQQTVAWAEQNGRRWSFTLSNAGAYYFEDRSNLAQLHEINWDAVDARKWSGLNISSMVKDGKQAEFLLERQFPWELVQRIGVISDAVAQLVGVAMGEAPHRPVIERRRDWYY